MNRAKLRQLILVLCAAMAVLAVAPARAQYEPIELPDRASGVAITSINGRFQLGHARTLTVYPGDVVNLGADVIVGGLPQRAYPDEFVWQSNLRGDSCDVGSNDPCLQHSNFQPNDYGVSYYVPYAMAQAIEITVASRDPEAVDPSGRPLVDTLVLVNGLYQPRRPLVLVAITNPALYPDREFNTTIALGGMGRWVWIDNVRYFAPYTYVSTGEVAWQPYRHGYWAWSVAEGWTWVSYDPWGWVTDHYGVWRHHGVYGWIWLPFADRRYQPHCVTWFHSGSYVGWYPYNDGFRDAYRAGARAGFDDGFWQGYKVGLAVGTRGFAFNPGFTIVNRTNITNVNITNVVVNRTVINQTTINVVVAAHKSNSFAPVPGGGSAKASREFLERGAARPATVTVVENVRTKGGAEIRMPKPVHPVPADSLKAARFGESIKGKPVPVGAVAQISAAPVAGGKPAATVVVPTTNGRGVVPPPQMIDAQGHATDAVPRQTKNPAILNAAHPMANPAVGPMAAPPVTKALTPGAATAPNGAATSAPPPAPRAPGAPPAPAAPVRAPAPAPAPAMPQAPPQREAPPAPIRAVPPVAPPAIMPQAPPAPQRPAVQPPQSPPQQQQPPRPAVQAPPPHPEPRVEPRPELHPEPRPQPRSETRPEVRPEPQPELRPSAVRESRRERESVVMEPNGDRGQAREEVRPSHGSYQDRPVGGHEHPGSNAMPGEHGPRHGGGASGPTGGGHCRPGEPC